MQIIHIRETNESTLKPSFKPYVSILQGRILGTAVRSPASDNLHRAAAILKSTEFHGDVARTIQPLTPEDAT